MTGRGRVYRIDATLPIGGEVRRIATARLDAAVAALRRRPAPSFEERAVAEVAVDDVRALLRLVRGGLDGSSRRSATKRLRAARAQIVADTRRPVIDAFERAADRAVDSVTDAALHRLRRSLAQESMLQAAVQALADDLGNGSDGPGIGSAGPGRWSLNPWLSIADDLDAAILGASLWVIEGEGFAPLADGFEREYRRAREALAETATDLRPEAHRVLADRVRDHQHHLALLRAAWPSVMKPEAREARRLLALVERQHDLGLLREALLARQGTQLRRDARALVGVLDEDRGELAAEVRDLGSRLFADDPATITARLASWWAAAAR